MKIYNTTVLFTLLWGFWTMAQDIPQDTIIPMIQLKEVLVKENKKTDAAFSTVQVLREDELSQPKNLGDLLDDINGFAAIKRGNYAIDPSFRASQYEQLNVQFNGGAKVMHACPNRMDPITTHVVPEEIARIEIIKGPYTVRYGATFGGVVNFVSRSAETYEKGYQGKVDLGGESNGASMTTQANVHYRGDRFDAALNLGHRNFGNYHDGDGTEVPAEFKSTDYGIKLGYTPTEAQRIQLQFRQSLGRDVLHAGLPMDTEKDDSSMLTLDYALERKNQTLERIDAKAYFSYVDHVMTNFNRPSFMMVTAESPVEATTLGGRVEFKLRPLKKMALYTGADLYSVAREGYRSRTVKRNMNGDVLANPMTFTDNIWQDSRITDYGLFLEGRYPLANKWIFSSGVRYDLVYSEIGEPDADFSTLYPDVGSRNQGNLSAHATFKFIPHTNFMLEMAVGRGVRSANMVERYINHFTVGSDSYEYVGNPNLKAEVNHQFEVGIKGNRSLNHDFLGDFGYGASVFYSLYDNYIAGVIDPGIDKKYMPNNPPTAVKRFVNIKDAHKMGFESYAILDFLDNFEAKLHVSYVHTHNKDLDESLPLTPPLTGKFDLKYNLDVFWTKATYSMALQQNSIAPSFGETVTAGYGIVDVRLGGSPIKHVNIGLAALNIFDKSYHDHLNFSFVNQAGFNRVPINEPGRNFSIFAQYRF